MSNINSAVCLTFDIDWAPNWAINTCLDLCRQASVPATIFATHKEQYLEDILADPLFEVGIHPNFLPNSDHGDDLVTVLDHCIAMVPGARAMRTHALYQSSRLFEIIANDFLSIETDVSLLLPLHPNLGPTDIYMGSQLKRITRLPYFWEDDTMASFPNWDWSNPIPQLSGLRIFDFHPTFVALNLSQLDAYIEFKKSNKGRPLYDLQPADFEPYTSQEKGSKDALVELLNTTPRQSFKRISEITSIHRGEIECA